MVDPPEREETVPSTSTTVPPAPVVTAAPSSTTTTVVPGPDIATVELRDVPWTVQCPGGAATLDPRGRPGPVVDGSSARIGGFEPQLTDITGDGRRDAVVAVSCATTGDGGPATSSVILLSTSGSVLAQVGGPLAGDRPEVVGRTVVVEVPADPSAPPGSVDRRAYALSWEGTWEPTAPTRNIGGRSATPEGIGPYVIGASYAEVVAAAGRPIEVRDPGGGDRCVEVGSPGGDTLVTGLGGGGVLRSVEVRTPQVRTAEGIGVGSTEDEVLTTYGRQAEVGPSALGEGLRRIVVYPDGVGDLVLRFTTNGQQVLALAVGEPEWAGNEPGCR